MTDIKINDKTTIALYSSIKELPIELSKKFNSYLMQDAGIGNTIEDVDDHLARLYMFVNGDKKMEAIEELKKAILPGCVTGDVILASGGLR